MSDSEELDTIRSTVESFDYCGGTLQKRVLGVLRAERELRLENELLRNAIRTHRSQKADDRCIEDDDKLYEVLGDGIKCDRRVGSKEEMLKNCARFIDRRCEAGKWPTYKELEDRVSALEEELADLYSKVATWAD